MSNGKFRVLADLNDQYLNDSWYPDHVTAMCAFNAVVGTWINRGDCLFSKGCFQVYGCPVGGVAIIRTVGRRSQLVHVPNQDSLGSAVEWMKRQ